MIALTLDFVDSAMFGGAMMVMVAGVYCLFLVTKDAKRIDDWLKTRPNDSAGDQPEAGIVQAGIDVPKLVAETLAKITRRWR
jgi:hypothetical protein